MNHMNIFAGYIFGGVPAANTLLSVACVAADGRSFYAEITDFDTTGFPEWENEEYFKEFPIIKSYPTKKTFYSARKFKNSQPMYDLYSCYSVKLRDNGVKVRIALKQWLGQFNEYSFIINGRLVYWFSFLDFAHFSKKPDYRELDEIFETRGKEIPRDIYQYAEVTKRTAAWRSKKIVHAWHIPNQDTLFNARIIKLAFERLEMETKP